MSRALELSATGSPLRVVAGILRDAGGNILVTQRLPGQHMAGRWEFPGGKMRAGETQAEALARELEEELGVELRFARPLIEIHHRYADRSVVLHVWSVERYAGSVRGREGQATQWVAVDALRRVDLLEADRPIHAALSLPAQYLITGEPAGNAARFLALLHAALERGIELVQLRAPMLDESDYADLARAAVAACGAHHARLLLNGDPRSTLPLALAIGAHGIHVPARHVASLSGIARPEGLLIGASCHDARELLAARDAGADFAVLGPVRATPSHSAAVELGWTGFAVLARGAGLPVFALGGAGPDDLPIAWAAGAQGIAAIRALWAAGD